jgi:site-specific DNA-methyltransferase (adenine-specific)
LERVSKNQIVWGGNFLGLCGGVIVWQKNGTAFGEAEVAICSTHKSVRVFEYTWNGMLQQNMKDKEIRIHPTQKPVALYEWILKNYAKEGDVILDTHLGSGSSRIACHKAGLDFVGCEIDKDYFDKQEARFKNFIAQMTLW